MTKDDSTDVTNWIRISRRLARSEWWLADPFSRGQAWVDLLMLANWKPGFVRIRGLRIDLERGQLAASSVWLASRWKWSRTKVGAFLNELEKEQQIRQQKTNVTNVVTITNYDKYQKESNKESSRLDSRKAADWTAERHTRRR